MNIPKVYINEIFDSIQGEGHLTGHFTKFVRFQGCSIGCVWCDTKVSWKKSTGEKWSVFDLSKEIINNIKKDTWVCFTGGEPLEQFKSLRWLVEKLHRADVRNMTLETCGSPIPDVKDIIDLNIYGLFFSVSPKLPSALKKRFDYDFLLKILSTWYNNVGVNYHLQFKFVVSGVEDLEVLETVFDGQDFYCHLFLQVEDSMIKDKRFLRKIYNFVKKHQRFRLTIQQHTIIGMR